VRVALCVGLFLALSVISVGISAVEAAFYMLRRRRVRDLDLPRDRAELLERYLDDPPRLLMPGHMGTYTAHVGMTICVTTLLVDWLSHWSLLVAFLVMMIYLLAFRLTLPYGLVRQTPERPLAFLLPAFDAYARALEPLVGALRRRADPEAEAFEELSERTEVPPPPVQETDADKLVDAMGRFSTRHVRDVMTPRPDMVAMTAGGTVGELRRLLTESRYSRVPVYEDNLDDIVGVVTVRDVVAFRGAESDPLRPLVREVMLIPDTKRVLDLLREFQARRTTFAVVIDEYGGTAGLVTVEDIVEEIVGEIADEFDVESAPITVEDDGAVLVSGRLNVDRLEEALDTPLSEGGVDTVGGLVASVFGRIPRPGERAEIRGFTLEVVDAERKRVNRVRFRRHPVQVEA
jgi:putative hemolysin